MYDIISCGSATVDVFACSQSELIKIKTAKETSSLIAYPSGSKVLIDELQYSIGGGGTNTAVSFSRLGLKTGYIGCVGSDGASVDVLNLLRKEKIDFLGHHCAKKTGYSIILDSLEHDRTILAFKGANNDLDFAKLKKNKLKAKWYYFSSMMANSFTAQKKLAEHAAKNGTKIAFNPSHYQVEEGLTKLKPLLKLTTILCFNREEAATLCGKKDVEDMFKELHSFGIQIIIITDGPHSLFCSDTKHLYELKPQKIAIKEATGAGDAFSSTFVAFYAKTSDISLSLKAGLINSQSVLTHYGAKEKLLSFSTIKKKVSGAKIRLTKKVCSYD